MFAMDTLGYAKRLRESGILTEQAEAHAEAARGFIMTELVTKSDLATAFASLREEISGVRRDMDTGLASIRHDQDTGLAGVRRDFRAALDIMVLRLTVRLGAMIGLAVAALAAIIKRRPNQPSIFFHRGASRLLSLFLRLS